MTWKTVKRLLYKTFIQKLKQVRAKSNFTTSCVKHFKNCICTLILPQLHIEIMKSASSHPYYLAWGLRGVPTKWILKSAKCIAGNWSKLNASITQWPMCISIKFVNEDFRNTLKYSGIWGPHLQRNVFKICSIFIIQTTLRKLMSLFKVKHLTFSKYHHSVKYPTFSRVFSGRVDSYKKYASSSYYSNRSPRKHCSLHLSPISRTFLHQLLLFVDFFFISTDSFPIDYK